MHLINRDSNHIFYHWQSHKLITHIFLHPDRTPLILGFGIVCSAKLRLFQYSSRPMSGQRNHSPSRTKDPRLIYSDFTLHSIIPPQPPLQKKNCMHLYVCIISTSIIALMHLKNLWQIAVMILRWGLDNCFYISFTPSTVVCCGFSLWQMNSL